MEPSQSIEMRLVDAEGQSLHVGNVAMELRFFVHGNFRYGFNVGRTDRAGCLSVSYSDIEKLRCEHAGYNLMDYNTKLEDCDQLIEISIPSESQIREQYDDAIQFYGVPPPWAGDWPSNAQLQPEVMSVDLVDPIARVDIQTEFTIRAG